MISHSSFSLKPYNTFGIEAHCYHFIELQQRDDVALWASMQQKSDKPFFLLGGGSNVVFLPWIDKSVVKVSLHGIELLKEDDEHVWIQVAAGENWSDFVDSCVQKGWGGLENLTGIPGTVGASPVQNVGAYGVEAKDVIESVEYFEIASGKWKTILNSECQFSYRDSIFKRDLKNQVIITSVAFRLDKNPSLNLSYGGIQQQFKEEGILQPTIKNVSHAVKTLRNEKLPDPAIIGSAGSFFKNPIVATDKYISLKNHYPDLIAFQVGKNYKLAAGWLIEQCGWKGKQMGKVGVYPKQALVLINLGACTGNDVKQLASAIQQSVQEKFDIQLETEALFIE